MYTFPFFFGSNTDKNEALPANNTKKYFTCMAPGRKKGLHVPVSSQSQTKIIVHPYIRIIFAYCALWLHIYNNCFFIASWFLLIQLGGCAALELRMCIICAGIFDLVRVISILCGN
jgi:hypothetical protein